MQVGDMEVAHTFYEEGLGLVYDPSVKSGQKKGVGVSWLNIGDQQVRLTAFLLPRACCKLICTEISRHMYNDTCMGVDLQNETQDKKTYQPKLAVAVSH